MSNKSNRFSLEVRERAVRMVQDHRSEQASLWAAIESIAPKIGCVPQTFHEWVAASFIEQKVQVLNLEQCAVAQYSAAIGLTATCPLTSIGDHPLA